LFSVHRRSHKSFADSQEEFVVAEVSIIMPALNGEAFIAEAIESVCAQTYDAWELIVVDDGSVDATRSIVS
jgi:teichuronic acid biosynthesis glycosyltransferase TuaG